MATAVVNGVVGEQLNGDELLETEDYTFHEESEASSLDQESSLCPDPENPQEEEEDVELPLPQCKIKRNYACPECTYFTQNPRFFLHHLKNVHKHKIRIYECPHCLYASKHSQKLHRHLQMVHVMGADKKRDSQKSSAKSQHFLPEEPEGEEREEEEEEEEEQQHEEEESECMSPPVAKSKGDGKNKQLKCSMCPFSSRSQTLITRHEKVVHLKKKFFRCSKCNYVTHMKARFTKHVKYHSMPMIKCEQCDFKTPYKWNLDRHMKNHMSDGAFKCSLCSFTADIKQSLTVHEMNHHVPPVGHAMPTKRKNRVGASDTHGPDVVAALTPQDHERAETELLRMEREGEMQQAQMNAFNELSMLSEIEITKKPDSPSPGKQIMKKPIPVAQFSAKELTMKIGEKVVNPGDVLQQKNGTVYIKKIKCRVCNYRAAWESEMIRHEQRVHGLGEKKTVQKRPIPNLIPIQNKPGAQSGPPSHPMPPSIPPPPPTIPMMSHPSRPGMQPKHLMPHSMAPHPHFQQTMNRHPFLPQHMQPQMNLRMPPGPQTHNLPPHFQPLPSRFAQPKNIMQKPPKHYPLGNQLPKPIKQKPSPPPPPILKIPTPTKIRASASPPPNTTPDKTMSEKDLNAICAKSCPTSALKDFASLMGGEEAFKPEGDGSIQQNDNTETTVGKSDKSQDSVSETQTEENGPKSPEAMKKKNSFFDQLKEKFGAGESCNLVCNLCGHESKCLSESLRHQKTHNIQSSSNFSGNVFSNADLSSTRCQYCRQRCKTSSDLLTHLKSCPEANKSVSDSIIVDEEEENVESKGEVGNRMEVDDNEDEEGEEYKNDLDDFDESEELNPPHPMENKVFVWTNLTNGEEDGLDDAYECGSQSPSSDCVFGIETAPGIGAVTSTNKAASHGNTTGQAVQQKEAKPKLDNTVKKVYKCPHCSFWASTASRFHVHIVGHLNKKPFECSLCCYRSNWRWDITKHIRLKTMRDSTHQRAKVLMTDETGRRNYSKYNKYLTLMRVHEPEAESGGSGQKGKKTTFEPIDSIPGPPKLIPAPQATLQGSEEGDNSSPEKGQFRTIYPKPPPLQHSFDVKHKSTDDYEDEPPKKKGLMENKKTMWKCKKCLFRDSDRAVVLAHVKGHYRNNQAQPNSQSDSADEASSNRLRLPDEGLPYMCGHCKQTSQWKHVIQRHCRLKHNGNVKVILAPRRSTEDPERNDEYNEPEGYMCETCPFVCNSQQSLDDHMERHFERPGASLKCYICPYYVYNKEELMEHISLHGEQEPDDTYSIKEDDSNNTYSSGGESGGDPYTNKRYRCTACPYVSNSKTQFLYHKQFHRPRGAPFQCNLCSYNVPQRHFLQQHLRLHGINTPLPKTKNTDFVMETSLNIKDIDTSTMPEIPLVWVSKLGSLTKMFKCRYCPHVNIRKSNIQEHEKMHGIRIKTNTDGSSPIPQQQHHCPECNYICNNAGVLSSHAKVHQGLFGQVCGLVDLSRSDEEQIKELNSLLGREEEGPPEVMPDEINKEYREVSTPQLQSIQSTPEKDSYTGSDSKILHFCAICPARFLYPKELEIHLRFHNLQLQFKCDSCSYTARQQPHLLAHYKVHTDEYQDRTNALCEVYQISEEHPKPKIAVIVDGSEEVGPAWVVVERQKVPAKDPQNEYDLDEAPSEVSQHGSRIVTKQFACDKCPATFFKSVALQYHLTLHGGPGPNKCRVCDYAVKTYGNLIKHEAVHEELEPRVKTKLKRPQDNIPTSGTELFKQKSEANQKAAAAPPPPPPPLHIDPEFGILMHGSPEFIYPTYLKNGRLKEKRYKCHKCPSAFEKREQYKVHLSLHGSKQRYNCERCDYSVKYYANYIQHLRKHQSNDATKAERKLSTDKSTDDSPNDDGSETPTETTFDEIQPQPPISCRSSKKMQLSMADQQTTMLMQQRVISNSVSAPEVTNRCPYCPYTNQRKEGVGSHVKCHSNIKGGAFTCKYCDYTVPQLHFLREHNKLHFSPLKGNRPEVYMKCDRLELWAEPILKDGEEKLDQEKIKKILIFKDRGVNVKENRFQPLYNVDRVDQVEECEKVYINLKTGEVDTSNSGNSSEKEEEKENIELTTEEQNNNSTKDVDSSNKMDSVLSLVNNENPNLVDDNESIANMDVDEEGTRHLIHDENLPANNIEDINMEEDGNGQIHEAGDLYETGNVAPQVGLDRIIFSGLDGESKVDEAENSNKLEEDLSSQQQSDGEKEPKSAVKGSSTNSSDSDTEDSSSDSSSSSDSEESSSSSVTSSQQP